MWLSDQVPLEEETTNRYQLGLLTWCFGSPFVRFAEFEILFIPFFVIAFIIFKDLVSPLFQYHF
ncbi:hypothetical protein Hanom_Chr11g01021101 [Helianthus anomalus]